MEKHYIDKRIQQMKKEGVEFKCNVKIGGDINFDELNQKFDAIVLACGSEAPRNLDVPGRDLKGIHFAMDFLTQQNKICEGDSLPSSELISAKDKDVVVIGGGDTGSDCIGTSNRQGAKSVTQLEILEKPPNKEDKLLVLEMGMRGEGQIENLSKFTEPDIAVITNIGNAHIGLLGSRENIAKAKCEITKY